MADTLSDYTAFGLEHVAGGIGRLTTEVFTEGQGSYISTLSKRRFLDFTCGIGVTNLGHAQPDVTAAAVKQCGTLVHAQINIGFSQRYIELVHKLLPKLPETLDTVFFWNSGAEAVEAAIKLARHATKKQNIIVMQGSYHGRTNLTAAMTRSKTIYGEGAGPLATGIFATAFPYYAQFGLPHDTPEDQLVQLALHQLRLTLQQQTAPADTAAIILEPVLGEGGYVPAPDAFLHGLRSICDEHNILLIADEVQSGYGRTGTFWAIEHSGVRPDVLIFAKGIANGFVLSGIASRKELMDKQKPGAMGGTYAGNAVSCAAAIAVLDVFERDQILANVQARSKQLLDFLANFRKTPAGKIIQDVRGRGLMIGVQFASSAVTNESSNHLVQAKATPQFAPKVVKASVERDMLILSTSVFDVVRLIPPLNVSEGEMEDGCRIFAEAVTSVAKEMGVEGA
ncbi:unnamed protein product [Tilletia controversa]|uniref:4-aminobutyrate aminotransferase n=3 Tax=Tilletia TaxID=13289 RepID=A0A8X7SZX3_9BASI|nr:hypothetical protein CF336_g371 [Tilletia laevis]KAE8205277.1 hypothetical protein CF328_g590 [Tilletia controversa]KAE8264890.1 hypothetical protein A4X03_0g636 [Tilletia caries]KAE8208567.1 hypothetical protein CF335_g317 [Tilletia laevis]KAE8254864.1 hypothetical protein A4X06_0g703 [Tilletia controversa]